MRILSLGTYIFAPIWRELGHTVGVVADVALPPHPDTLRVDFFEKPQECESRIKSIIDLFEPDLIFQGDHSTPLIHCGLESVTIPKVWLAIDTHLHRAWHRHYAAAFDLIFCAQQPMVPVMAEYGRRAEWLPLFCQYPSEFLPWDRRTFEVSFVGTLDAAANPDRVRLLDGLRQRGIPLHTATGAYTPLYRSSKIVINQAVADDLNLRFYEATGCGALLVTDRLSHSMNVILEEGVDFLSYVHNDAEDLAAKISWALANPAEAESMARRAHAKITEGYLEEHGARRVIARFQRLLDEQGSAREEPEAAIAHCAWSHDYCSRLALPLSLCTFFAGRSERLAALGRSSPEGRPWALLVLAARAIDNENFALAGSFITQIAPLPNDPDFRLRYWSLKAEAAAFSGDKASARESLSIARKEFPADKELLALAKAIGLRIASSDLRYGTAGGDDGGEGIEKDGNPGKTGSVSPDK
jgi:hypothetical protein